jgi:hypothetical protein
MIVDVSFCKKKQKKLELPTQDMNKKNLTQPIIYVVQFLIWSL